MVSSAELTLSRLLRVHCKTPQQISPYSHKDIVSNQLGFNMRLQRLHRPSPHRQAVWPKASDYLNTYTQAVASDVKQHSGADYVEIIAQMVQYVMCWFVSVQCKCLAEFTAKINTQKNCS